jgi:FkbM family methyltransferase
MIKVIKLIYSHPLNKGRRLKSIIRFLIWQLISRVFKYPILLPFTDKTEYLCWNGLTGLTGNWYYGLMEMEEMAFVLHYLNSSDTFYDIGANVGSYSILAGLHKECKTYAFEPHPKTFGYLKRNISLGNNSDNVILLNIGLGSKKGVVNFTSDQDTANHVATQQDTNVIEVDISVLDDLNIHPPSIIKLDVEGFELEVLRGATSTLNNDELKAIIIELNGSGVRFGYKDDEIDNLLRSFGFEPFTYNPFNRELIRLEKYLTHNTIYIRSILEVKDRLLNSESVKLSTGVSI